MTETAQSTGRLWSGVAVPAPGVFDIDAAHSRVGFVARHLVVSKVRGAFTAVRGSVTVAEDPAASAVVAEIDAASIDTGAPDRDAHLRSADFLDVGTFPSLSFRSTGLAAAGGGRFRMAGALTIRDVTRPVELAVEFDGAVVSPWGKEVAAFTATTQIDREEFGITWNQALETGGVLVGRTVTIELSIQAIRR